MQLSSIDLTSTAISTVAKWYDEPSYINLFKTKGCIIVSFAPAIIFSVGHILQASYNSIKYLPLKSFMKVVTLGELDVDFEKALLLIKIDLQIAGKFAVASIAIPIIGLISISSAVKASEKLGFTDFYKLREALLKKLDSDMEKIVSEANDRINIIRKFSKQITQIELNIKELHIRIDTIRMVLDKKQKIKKNPKKKLVRILSEKAIPNKMCVEFIKEDETVLNQFKMEMVKLRHIVEENQTQLSNNLKDHAKTLKIYHENRIKLFQHDLWSRISDWIQEKPLDPYNNSYCIQNLFARANVDAVLHIRNLRRLKREKLAQNSENSVINLAHLFPEEEVVMAPQYERAELRVKPVREKLELSKTRLKFIEENVRFKPSSTDDQPTVTIFG